MSLITINSKADLEEAFNQGKRKGKQEMILTLFYFLKDKAMGITLPSSSYAQGAYDAYEDVLGKIIEIVEKERL